jgi:hypothetical protein
MSSYLLLRNNKQSGPYSFQQLLNAGLRPYDLIWIEGKSAAWRYPSEVNELKPFAPAVEEQPFDRFYKKPDEPIQLQALPGAIKPENSQTPVSNPWVLSKKVFVSLPDNPAPQKNEVVTSIPVPPVSEIKSRVTAEEKNELKEEYSESLDDIKKRYTEVYLNQKKKKNWSKNLAAALQVAGGAIFFCALVVLAYKNFSEEEKPARQKKTAEVKPVTPENKMIPHDEKPAANIQPSLPDNSIPVIPEEKNNAEIPSTTEEHQLANIRPGNPRYKTTSAKPGITTKNKTVEKPVADTKVKEDAAAEEIKSLKPEINKPVMKPEAETIDIRKLVAVSANKYRRRAFGGILNLELTVKNDSKYVLDKVIVELQYLKPGEEPLKTDKIIFIAIAPNGSQTIRVPDFLRGVKVKFTIEEIESSQLNKFTAGL